jgi:hypothetical protein
MNALATRNEPATTAQAQRAAVEYHNRVLLRAFQTAHPVTYNDRVNFIHMRTYQQSGGAIETVVYLSGLPKPLKPEQVQLAKVPKNEPAPTALESEAT